MNRLQHFHRYRKRILRGISNQIRITITGAAGQEPAIVREIHHDMVDMINNIPQAFYQRQGFQIAAGSIFVHQSPKVTGHWLTQRNSIEIGDVLFLRTYISLNNHIERTALLYQAKMGLQKAIPQTEIDQLELYRYWPEFRYHSPAPLTGQVRQVVGPNLYNGAKYLLLDQQNSPYSLVADPSGKILTNRREFSLEFYDFIFGHAGRKYHLCGPYKCIGWSRVIQDLLSVTATRTSRTLGGAQRGYGLENLVNVGGNMLGVVDQSGEYGNQDPPSDVFTQEPSDDEHGLAAFELVIREQG